MRYITGLISFGIPCNEDSCGTWMFTKSDFSNPDYVWERESSDSPFKDAGIEKDKIVLAYGDESLYNVAVHSRAYLDILYEKKFKLLDGLFYDYIQSKTCRYIIFCEVYDKLRKLDGFDKINEFMSKEFGNAWLSFAYDSLSHGGPIDAEHIST